MTKKSPSIIAKLYPISFVALLLVFWWALCHFEIVPGFMLPSPQRVVVTLGQELPNILPHAAVSLTESFYGLASSIVAAFLLTVLMDRYHFLYQAVYPVVVITQTIPTIALAPLLVLWLGFGMIPKVVLIFITCFFPLVISLLGGFRSVDQDIVRLYQSMGAARSQILWQVKVPMALDSFFSGLRVAAVYSIVGAVIAEWLGGNNGLGVYMTRVRKSFAYDKMFAVIVVISVLSLLIMKLVDVLHKRSMPWKQVQKQD